MKKFIKAVLLALAIVTISSGVSSTSAQAGRYKKAANYLGVTEKNYVKMRNFIINKVKNGGKKKAHLFVKTKKRYKEEEKGKYYGNLRYFLACKGLELDPELRGIYAVAEKVVCVSSKSNMKFKFKGSRACWEYWTSGYDIDYNPNNRISGCSGIKFLKKLNSAMEELDLDGKSDYEKVKAIQDWITENVTYYNDDNYCYTAYGALVKGYAVCEGYSELTEIMFAMAGLPVVRCSSIKEGHHAFNIVKVDGKWYYIDTCWTAIKEWGTRWFLKNEYDFTHADDGSIKNSHIIRKKGVRFHSVKLSLKDLGIKIADKSYPLPDEDIQSEQEEEQES